MAMEFVVLVFFALLAFLFLFSYLIPIRLWLAARFAGAHVSLATLIGMRFRRVPPKVVVEPRISAVRAGLDIPVPPLESHYLAGGNVAKVVYALISADKAGIELDFQRAAAIDLAGRDVLEAVKMSVNPKVITTPVVAAVAKDGIQLKAVSRVTVRANIDRLVGGAGEETILARVGEGIVTTVGSAENHARVLENPDMISKTVLDKGLDSRFFRSISQTSTSARISAPSSRPIRPKPTSRSPRPAPRVGAPWLWPPSRKCGPRPRRCAPS